MQGKPTIEYVRDEDGHIKGIKKIDLLKHAGLKLDNIQQGRSEIILKHSMSLGVSQIRVHCPRDFFACTELAKLMYKIDNSASKARVRSVEVRLVRSIKFRSHSEIAEALQGDGTNIKRTIIWQKVYRGAEPGELQDSFTNRMHIDLARVFGVRRAYRFLMPSERNHAAMRHGQFERVRFGDALPFLTIAPSSLTHSFHCCYHVEVSMHHVERFVTEPPVPAKGIQNKTELDFEVQIENGLYF